MTLFFPDNTVLINFAILDRLDLLRDLAQGNGRWCMSVAHECDRSARFLGRECLGTVGGFLKLLTPTPAELSLTQVYRSDLADPWDKSHTHLGEAETVAIIETRGLSAQAVYVTDDSGAFRFASGKGITTIDTWDLLGLSERTQRITTEQRVAYEALMQAEGRSPARR